MMFSFYVLLSIFAYVQCDDGPNPSAELNKPPTELDKPPTELDKPDGGATELDKPKPDQEKPAGPGGAPGEEKKPENVAMVQGYMTGFIKMISKEVIFVDEEKKVVVDGPEEKTQVYFRAPPGLAEQFKNAAKDQKLMSILHIQIGGEGGKPPGGKPADEGKPAGPDGKPAGPDGKPAGPDGKPAGPEGKPAGPEEGDKAAKLKPPKKEKLKK